MLPRYSRAPPLDASAGTVLFTWQGRASIIFYSSCRYRSAHRKGPCSGLTLYRRNVVPYIWCPARLLHLQRDRYLFRGMLRGFGLSRVPPVFPWCIVITLLRCITTKSLRYSVFPQPVPKRAFGWNRTSPIALALALPSKLQRQIFRRGQEDTPAGCWEGGNRNGKKNGGNGMEAHPRYDRSEKSLL